MGLSDFSVTLSTENLSPESFQRNLNNCLHLVYAYSPRQRMKKQRNEAFKLVLHRMFQNYAMEQALFKRQGQIKTRF